MSERSVAILGGRHVTVRGVLDTVPGPDAHCRAPEGSGYQPEGTGVLLELRDSSHTNKGRSTEQTRGPLRVRFPGHVTPEASRWMSRH